jgi:hypothetical protein
MSENQKMFMEMLQAHYPRLKQYWSCEPGRSPELRIGDAKHSLASGVLCSGECVILKALVAIWLGGVPSTHPEFLLDFSDLATLDRAVRLPLVQWLADPYWP